MFKFLDSTGLAHFWDGVKAGINAIKTVEVTSSSFSSLPVTITDSNITADHVVVNSVLSNPSAQTGDWTVTTAAGSLTIAGSISGSTTVTLYLNVKQ